MLEQYTALIALDWADKKHDGCIRDQRSGLIKHFRLSHSPESIDKWVQGLNKRFGNKRFAIILEQSKGALLSALLKYDCFDIFPANPSSIAKYREAFAPSGAKSDTGDAALMLDYLQRHFDKLTAWKPDDENTRKLRLLVEQRRTLVDDRKRIGNRLTDLLKGYYPQVLELFPKMGRAVLCHFVLQYPSLAHAQGSSRQELLQFFKKHRSGRSALLEKRINYLESTIALTQDPAIIDTSILMATALSEQMLTIIKSIELYEKEIENLFLSHQDAKLFNSLPASGQNMAPRLLVAFGAQRERFTSASQLQRVLGIAPVLEQSGNKSWVHWRYNCSKFNRQSIHEWAGITIKHSLWARAYYAMQRAKGKSHPIAVRALAYKWIRIIFRLWTSNQTYCEATYLAALQRNGSPIIRFLADNPDLEKLKFSTAYA